jgi:CopG antitoxin of type II toxin-antitoxin system
MPRFPVLRAICGAAVGKTDANRTLSVIFLPEDMLAELKILANKKDAPYQSLAKIYLARQIALERSSSSISQGNNANH